MLLLITSCQRVQAIEFLKLSRMIIGREEIVFTLDKRLKHNTKGRLQLLQFKEFKLDLKLCVVFTINHYIGRTKDICKNEDRLMISYKPPYYRVSANTMSRWTRELMEWSGLDSTVFTTHSIRSAVSSQMFRNKVPTKDILKRFHGKVSACLGSSIKSHSRIVTHPPSLARIHARGIGSIGTKGGVQRPCPGDVPTLLCTVKKTKKTIAYV